MRALRYDIGQLNQAASKGAKRIGFILDKIRNLDIDVN
jgi:hypothetical protein